MSEGNLCFQNVSTYLFAFVFFTVYFHIKKGYESKKGTSGQDRGVGSYTLPPYTTKRTTTSLRAKNNQNCQKIELYGSLTTKEIKKKRSPRLVGGAERGSWGREDAWQGDS